MVKPAKRKGPAAAIAQSTISAKLGFDDPPAPYSTSPPALVPFLATLDTKHIYITHIDEHPRAFKRRIFIVPILLNIAITGLLIWRAVYIFPYYTALVLTLLGYPSPTNIDTAKSSSSTLISIAVGRTGVFFFDFALASFVLSWPLDFFFGVRSPTNWRRKIGFQDKEIAVRRSRTWDAKLPKKWLADGADNMLYKEKIVPAIDRGWIKKTSYLMMNKDWDLDFAAMVKAHEMVEEGKNCLADFEKTVMVYSDGYGWLVWQVWKMDEDADESRKKLVLFKDKLTAMGKENLFFRWIELIQFGSSHPGGFTPERQQHVMNEAKELFESQGVDFNKFWKEVGGVEGLPGMEGAMINI